MTIRTDERNHGRDAREQVDVAPGVPTDRVRWGPILAGTFAALTVLAVLSALGAAIGLSAYDPGDDARRYAVGAGIWGVISMLLAFGFGGWMAARSAAVRGGNTGLINGFMVAGAGIPLLLGALGGASVLIGHGEVASDRNVGRAGQFDSAQQATAVLSGESGSRSNAAASDQARHDDARGDEVRRAGRGAAWSTLMALVLAIGAASIGGHVGARDDHFRGENNPRRSPGANAGVPT